ncbi:aldose epimerase family protein [Anaerosporobacter faecicola]|uniref:aldose epimerase family protein n=1 Tax=Anaerosporobacter faecicola TaxID=2718714 RepID=UPI00143C8A54|nr:aldose epimerase family protein [Anaerosporobacter faecicola]
MSIKKSAFGKTMEGEQASLYTLKNKSGMTAVFSDYGAVLVKLLVPDANGKLEDVVLGYDKLEQYTKNAPGFGSFIGRHANRIGNASFILNGKTYELEKNDGNNNLHSGRKSFNKFLYETEYYEDEESASIEFSRLSPDMEQGFPGNLDITVTYTLTDENELVMEYLAVPDKDTVVNFTNHSYFNLSGHAAGSILNHKVWINADQFTPTDDALIPTGEFADVEGTPMDFRTAKEIGRDIQAEYKPLKQAGGYDHNFVLKHESNDVELVAELTDEASGRKMEVYTDLPGMQFYTANFLNGEKGKDGVEYHSRDGVCFETQFYPNSCNIPEFPSSVTKADQQYDYVTVYKFTTI